MPLIVLENKYDGHLGSARNTAAEFASGEVLAFLDDDAAAAADWLERLLAPYDDERVGAVGGTPLPVFEVRRPRWFPHEFDWVFGCAYRGLPVTRATTRASHWREHVSQTLRLARDRRFPLRSSR